MLPSITHQDPKLRQIIDDSTGPGPESGHLPVRPVISRDPNLVSHDRAEQAREKLDQWGLTTISAKDLVKALAPADYAELRKFVDSDPEFKSNDLEARLANVKSDQVRELLKLFKDYYEKFSATFPRHEIEDMPTYVRYLKGNLKDGGLQDWDMAILRDKESGAVIGGYQYQIFHDCKFKGQSINVAMGEHLWLAEGQREKNYGPELGNLVWGGAMLDKGAKIKLGEMDDWNLMSSEEISGSSIDPQKRAGFWRFMNQQGIDAPYIQLRLSGAEKPCTTLKMCLMVLDQDWAASNLQGNAMSVGDYRNIVTPYLVSMIDYPVANNATYRAWMHMLDKMEAQGVSDVSIGPNDLKRRFPQEPLQRVFEELRAMGRAIREDNLYNEMPQQDSSLRALKTSNIISLKETFVEDPERVANILANFQKRISRENQGRMIPDQRAAWLAKLTNPDSAFDIVVALNPINNAIRGLVVHDGTESMAWISSRVRNLSFEANLRMVVNAVQKFKEEQKSVEAA